MHKDSRVNTVENEKNERKFYLNLAKILYLKVLFFYFLELFSTFIQRLLIDHLLVLGRKEMLINSHSLMEETKNQSISILATYVALTLSDPS